MARRVSTKRRKLGAVQESLEVPPRLKMLLDEKRFRAAMNYAVTSGVIYFREKKIPDRFDRTYARSQLGHRNMGSDNLPFFTKYVKSQGNRRFIDGVTDSTYRGSQTPKGNISMSVKIRSPWNMRGKHFNRMKRNFKRIPNQEARDVAFHIMQRIEFIMNSPAVLSDEKVGLKAIKRMTKNIRGQHDSKFKPMMTRLKASLVYG